MTQVDSLAVNLHDAVVLYALGLNKSITQGTEDCKVVKNDMVNLTFNGSCFLGQLFLMPNIFRNIKMSMK